MGGMRLTQGKYDEEDDEGKWCTGEAFDSGSEDGNVILHHCMRCGGKIGPTDEEKAKVLEKIRRDPQFSKSGPKEGVFGKRASNSKSISKAKLKDAYTIKVEEKENAVKAKAKALSSAGTKNRFCFISSRE
jgi:hypothetical protein